MDSRERTGEHLIQNGSVRPKDIRFVPRFRTLDQIDLTAELGGDPARSDKKRLLGNALLIALFFTWLQSPEHFIAYSRDKSRYVGLRRYFGGIFTYAAMMDVIDRLCRTGLIDHDKKRPLANGKFSSRIRLKAGTNINAELFDCRCIALLEDEVLILRSANKKPIEYVETNLTSNWRIDIIDQNDAIAGLTLDLTGPNVHRHELGLVYVDGQQIIPNQIATRRIFNRDWLHGGRWYGPWYQQLPACDRARILIDSTPTVELDYPQLHPRLLIATAGISVPAHYDFYSIQGYNRSHVKVAVSVLLNAETKAKARAALVREFRGQIEQPTGPYIDELLNQIVARIPELEPYWGTGIGLRLQCIDGAIVSEVQQRLRQQGIVSLSIHDSFIVKREDEKLLGEEMERALEIAMADLAQRGL